MLHAVFLLLFMLVAAPLASYIPLSALAAVLAVVAWNMAEKHEFATLLRASRGDAVVLLATFLLVVFRDLTEGIVVGFGIGALLFLHRMAQAVEIEKPPSDGRRRIGRHRQWQWPRPYDVALATDPDVVVYRISGAFFFGAAATRRGRARPDRRAPEGLRDRLLGRAGAGFTAAATIEGFVRKAHGKGAAGLYLRAPATDPADAADHGVRPPRVRFRVTVEDAIEEAHGRRPAWADQGGAGGA